MAAKSYLNYEDLARKAGFKFGPNEDFHSQSGDVSELLKLVKRAKYRKAKNANGSTARMFWERINREVCAVIASPKAR